MKTNLAALALALSAATATAPAVANAPASTPKQASGPVVGSVSAKEVKLNSDAITVTADHPKGTEKVNIEMTMFGKKSLTTWSCVDTVIMNQALDLTTPNGHALRRKFVEVATEEVTNTAGEKRVQLRVDQKDGPVYEATIRERLIDTATDEAVAKNRLAIRVGAQLCNNDLK